MIAAKGKFLSVLGRNWLTLVLMPAMVFACRAANGGLIHPEGWIEIDTQTFNERTAGVAESYIRSKTEVQDSTLKYDIIEGYQVADDGNVYVAIVRDGILKGCYYYPGGVEDLPPQTDPNWWDPWLEDPSVYGDADELLYWWYDYLDWYDGDYQGDYHFWVPEPSALLLSGFALLGLFCFMRKHARR